MLLNIASCAHWQYTGRDANFHGHSPALRMHMHMPSCGEPPGSGPLGPYGPVAPLGLGARPGLGLVAMPYIYAWGVVRGREFLSKRSPNPGIPTYTNRSSEVEHSGTPERQRGMDHRHVRPICMLTLVLEYCAPPAQRHAGASAPRAAPWQRGQFTAGGKGNGGRWFTTKKGGRVSVACVLYNQLIFLQDLRIQT